MDLHTPSPDPAGPQLDADGRDHVDTLDGLMALHCDLTDLRRMIAVLAIACAALAAVVVIQHRQAGSSS